MENTEVIKLDEALEASQDQKPDEVKDPTLTQAQIVAEATGSPTLSKDEFSLGDRTFKVVSLGYRQYLQFISKLEPILKLVAGKMKSGISEAAGIAPKQVAIPGLILTSLTDVDPSMLMRFCSDELPEMVEIVCNMAFIREKETDSLITAKWIEDVAETPFQLINIVLKQVNHNKMIVEFASFFAQVLPMFMNRKAAEQVAK